MECKARKEQTELRLSGTIRMCIDTAALLESGSFRCCAGISELLVKIAPLVWLQKAVRKSHC